MIDKRDPGRVDSRLRGNDENGGIAYEPSLVISGTTEYFPCHP